MSTAVFALYSLGTLIGFNVSAWVSTSSDAEVDPQIIVVSALYVILMQLLLASYTFQSSVVCFFHSPTHVESRNAHIEMSNDG
jgi:hypothetical protein